MPRRTYPAPMSPVVDANEFDEISIFIFEKAVPFLGNDRITSEGNFIYANDGWRSQDFTPTDSPITAAALLLSY